MILEGRQWLTLPSQPFSSPAQEEELFQGRGLDSAKLVCPVLKTLEGLAMLP